MGRDSQGPFLRDVVPDVSSSEMRAGDLNATGITLTFAEPIGPLGEDPERLIRLWEVALLQIEDVAAGVSREPAFSLNGPDLTLLPGQDVPFEPATNYVLHALVSDTFGGRVVTVLAIHFSTE